MNVKKLLFAATFVCCLFGKTASARAAEKEMYFGIHQTDSFQSAFSIDWNDVIDEKENPYYHYHVYISKDNVHWESSEGIGISQQTLSLLEENMNYYVRVEAWSGILCSGNHDKKTCLAKSTDSFVAYTYSSMVEGVKQTGATDNSISMEWTPLNYADGYNIYLSKNKDEYGCYTDFEKVGTVTGTSYVAENLNPSTEYCLKVKAYKNRNGFYQEGIVAESKKMKTDAKTAEKKVEGTRVSKGKKFKISWKKISGIQKYEIYLSLKKNKGFKKVKTVSAKKTSATISKYGKKKLSLKKKYYIQVRYVTKDGKKKVLGKITMPAQI